MGGKSKFPDENMAMAGLNSRATATEAGLAARYRAAFLAEGMPADEVERFMALYERERDVPSFPAWPWEEEMRRQKAMNLPRDDDIGWSEV